MATYCCLDIPLSSVVLKHFLVYFRSLKVQSILFLIYILLQKGGESGEIMFSLSYLPTAERLTVVVVKARNLKFPHERETGDPFVKVRQLTYFIYFSYLIKKMTIYCHPPSFSIIIVIQQPFISFSL